ncbi:MAG: adenylate/guanylate cyclase domain-containing protein [Spirochaetia bacterium]|nr:adenylate/guanylate cyclase domain-containing protein [Spirochaetia bacterium]
MNFPDIDARKKAARELARCHRLHLVCELHKSEELLSNITSEGITFKEHTEQMLQELDRLVPGIENEQPEDAEGFSPNLMQEWFESAGRLPGVPPYENGTFKAMNVFFMYRLKFILNPSDEIRKVLIQYITEYFINRRVVDLDVNFRYFNKMEITMNRLIEKRFRFLGFEPIDEYTSIIDQLSGIFQEAFFIYMYNLAQEARARSDKLLRNILPDALADELRDDKTPFPVHYDSATVVFTDFVGFSRTAGNLSASELVETLDRYFSACDTIIDKYGLEKLKTIGDSYMFAGGIPETCSDHAVRCVKAALEIRDYMRNDSKDNPFSWNARIGVHTGPIVAGIIGHKKFSYDIWGNAVNIASRMESSGDPDCVNISEDTYKIVKDEITCREIGVRTIKNCGEMKMFSAEKII